MMYQAKWIDHRWPCPRCGNRPTLHLYDRSSLCVNCKLRWRPDGAVAPANSAASAAIEYPFSADELRRLAVYRAAVLAGFFNDRLDEERVAR
jgi:hypothetical protein